MKKTLSLIIALVMLLSLGLVGCKQEAAPSQSTATANTNTAATTDAPAAPAAQESKPEGAVSKNADGKYAISKSSQNFYSFVSSSSGGTWYNMVGGAINLFNDTIEGVNFSVEASGGSVENVRRVSSGEAEFGLGYASHIYAAINGTGAYEGKPVDTIRILASVFASPHYFVTTADSGIKTMADLAGKTVSLGEAGSGTSANSRMALSTLGIEVNAVEMSFADAARALQDGQISALGQGGAPASGVVELAAAKEIYIIPFTDEELAKIVAQDPSFYADKLPANTYEGQTEAVPTFFYAVYMICHKDVPDDLAAACVATAMEPKNLEYLTSVHRQWATLKYDEAGVAALNGQYHPGALAYWKEAGK